jgi:2-amino-4-hydroxy-6-hydroxymethyldihydropteridine diphosphokinase
MTSLGAAENNETVLIAYGSNMSSGRKTASQAFAHVVKTLRKRGVEVRKSSSLWRSLAWPDPKDPPYVNAVIQVKTDLQPSELMDFLHDIEREAGRVRTGVRNAPRILDLDLIAYGDRVLTGENGLIVPHPRARDRAFVMGPIAEIQPDWLHPVLQKTAAELYKDAQIGKDAYPLGEDDAR